MVPLGYILVSNVPKALHEVTELRPSDVCRNKAKLFILGNIKVRLMSYEVAVGAYVTQRRLANYGATQAQRPGPGGQTASPEIVRGQVSREGLDEYPVVHPAEVQSRVFGHDDFSTMDLLPVQCVDIGMRLGGHHPKVWGHGLEFGSFQLLAQEVGEGYAIISGYERISRQAG